MLRALVLLEPSQRLTHTPANPLIHPQQGHAWLLYRWAWIHLWKQLLNSVIKQCLNMALVLKNEVRLIGYK